MKTRQTASEPLPASDLFVLGRPLSMIRMVWIRYHPSYINGMSHADKSDGYTFCGQSTFRAEDEGRSLAGDADKHAWPSCGKCAANLRKHGLLPPWQRTNGMDEGRRTQDTADTTDSL